MQGGLTNVTKTTKITNLAKMTDQQARKTKITNVYDRQAKESHKYNEI